MTIDNYNPSAALDAYFPSRDERRIARLWAREKVLHDLADMGVVSFFEGPGPDPTVLDGYDPSNLWLHTSAGVTSGAGVVRYNDGGDPADIASWPALTREAFAEHIGAVTELSVDGTKLQYLTVTAPTDIDAIRDRVNSLDAAVVLRGTWAANSGSFPGSDVAQAGDSWIVSSAGVVDGVAFAVGDRIIAIAQNASSSTFANNWFKADYTDQVLSVAGRTGSITLTASDITDSSSDGRSILSAANYAAIRTLLAVQPLDGDLTSLSSLSSTGIAVRTAADTWAQRTVTGTANEITVANGNGVSGNPTFSLPSALTFTGKTVTGGTFASPTAITGLPTPTNSQDAATKSYVDSQAGGVGLHTIYIPAGALRPRLSNGPAAGAIETTTNKIVFDTLDFDGTTQELAQFSIRMPKSWNEGTVQASFTWSHDATTTNFGVVWALEAVALSDGDAGDAAFGTAQQVADTGGTTNTIYVTGKTPALTVGGSPAAEDWVVFQFKRVPADGSDTMAVDARLHSITLYLTTDAATDA